MKFIGTVTEEEKNIIYNLFEEDNALINLRKMTLKKKLYEKVCEKTKINQEKQKEWWDKISIEHNLNIQDSGTYIINFKTNELFEK